VDHVCVETGVVSVKECSKFSFEICHNHFPSHPSTDFGTRNDCKACVYHKSIHS